MDVAQLFSYLPIDPNVNISWDEERRVFRFSCEITAYSSPSFTQYVASRRGRSFKPHETRFELDSEGRVRVEQSIPFSVSPRKAVSEFRKLVAHCRELLRDY